MSSIQGEYFESGAGAYKSAAAEEQALVKSGAGKLFAIIVTNFNAAGRWVYLFDSSTNSGALLVPPVYLPAGGSAGSTTIVQVRAAIPFANGLYVASSSTGPIYTAAASADLIIAAFYK